MTVVPLYILNRGYDYTPSHSCKFFNFESHFAAVSGNESGDLYFWNITTRKPFAKLEKAHSNSIYHIETYQKGAEMRILTVGRDNKFKEWSLCSLAALFEERLHCLKMTPIVEVELDLMHFCNFSRNEEYVVFSLSDNTIEIRVQPDYSLFGSFNSGKKYGICMALKVTTDNLIVIGYENGNIMIRDLKGNVVLDQNIFQETILTLDVNSKNQIIVGSPEQNFRILHLGSEQTFTLLKSVDLRVAGINHMRWRSDNKLFALGDWGSNIKLYSQKGKFLACLKWHREGIYCVDLASFQGINYIIASSKDGFLSLWSVY